jgi:hypothetical protein
MKRTLYIVLAGGALCCSFTTAFGQQSQSLGDYARAVRKADKKGSPRQFDNDNLPKTDKLSVVGKATSEPDDKPAKDAEAVTDSKAAKSADQLDSDKPVDKSSAGPDDAKQKVNEEWKQKIADQRSKVDLLTRELDVLQREYRLRAAAFYADAGNRLRDQAAWDKEDARYKQQIADKQKSIDDAKQQLEDLEEKARKAGVPSAMRE